MSRFLFTTGIEAAYPGDSAGRGGTIRRDQSAETGHYARWREDFELVKSLGVSHVRWGPPTYATWLGPGRYDWSFCDEALAALEALKIAPILDLCHFGMPDWLGNSFQNPDFPEHFAEYAGAVA